MKRRCLKKGHRERERTFEIYKQPSEGFRCVADLCDRTEKYCSRCGEVFLVSDVVITSYNGITLPLDMARPLNSKGWVKI